MKSIKDFRYFEVSNPEAIRGGLDIKTKACLTIEVKVCVTMEIKKCYTQEVKCTSPFSMPTDDGKSVGW
ncbi:MAG: hypothetical protein LBS50_06400 [Prevotellaceae bacterium]|jgi:hypothetical protein|nr:hypothetical protein [Prevotellaceae bacterium]